jgi:hypothetical protein
MIQINDLFLTKMIQEVGFAFQHGVNIKTPITHALPPTKLIHDGLMLPQSLIELYSQTSKLTVSWELQDTEINTQQFREDTWLKETYLDQNYDWGVVHEYLSGFINITNAEDIFNPKFCKEQAYYYTLSDTEENQDSFFAFDICWSLTACLKTDGNNILDNVWLVHTDSKSVYNMEINIETYLNLAYQSKGFHYWQLIYLFKEKTAFYELMKRFLPRTLPHVPLNLKAFCIQDK